MTINTKELHNEVGALYFDCTLKASEGWAQLNTPQDKPYYGVQVFAFEILELTEHSYKEQLASKKPLITKSGKGWNRKGMHHLDLHKVNNEWIGIVDGQR